MLGDVLAVVPTRDERSFTRRRLALMSAVTFVLLAACALVCLSSAPNGFRSPTVGAAGVESSSVRVVTDPPALRISCVAPASTAPSTSPTENCRSDNTASAVTPAGSGCSTKVPSLSPASTVCPGALTADATAMHSRWLDAGASRSGTTLRNVLGGGAITPSHHHVKRSNGTTRNGSSVVHIVFTQAGTERWDSTSTSLPRDVPSLLEDQVVSDSITQLANTSIATVDNKVQISFGNISAARTQQFSSSL